MKQEENDTPPPWVFNGAKGRIEDSKGNLICTPVYEYKSESGTTYGEGSQLPNAKLIVKAVNNHQKLVDYIIDVDRYLHKRTKGKWAKRLRDQSNELLNSLNKD